MSIVTVLCCVALAMSMEIQFCMLLSTIQMHELGNLLDPVDTRHIITMIV